LQAFVRASQHAQAHALQIALEHHRRRKALGAGGVLIWQFNEPWPAISWALVDHAHQPKIAYETVRRLLAPLLVSLEYPLQHYRAGDRLVCNLWVVNDRHEALADCELEVVLWDGAGMPVERSTLALDITADSALRVGSLDWTLPPITGWRLTCKLCKNGQTLASNEYDLAIHDDIQPTLGQRTWARLSSLVMPA
jgi:beta-mannosidase